MSQPSLGCAIASLRGTLVEALDDSDDQPLLEELAATLPEIFGTVDSACLDRIAERLGAEPGGERFAEVLLLSESRVHVIQPLTKRDGQALLAVSPAGRSVGLILSQCHARLNELEQA